MEYYRYTWPTGKTLLDSKDNFLRFLTADEFLSLVEDGILVKLGGKPWKPSIH